MTKLYLSTQELRAAGFSEPMVRTFQKLAEFVDQQAALAVAQAGVDANADSITDLAANDVALDTRIDTLTTRANTADTALASLDTRIDAYDALAPFVRQDQAAAPAYTPYAGQTVSAAYVQAEAQATDDAVKALGAVVDDLKTAIQTANVLT